MVQTKTRRMRELPGKGRPKLASHRSRSQASSKSSSMRRDAGVR